MTFVCHQQLASPKWIKNAYVAMFLIQVKRNHIQRDDEVELKMELQKHATFLVLLPASAVGSAQTVTSMDPEQLNGFHPILCRSLS